MSFKKVLVCCPTANVKNYCFEQWIENVMQFNYPNFDIRVFDNSVKSANNTQFLNETFRKLFGSSKKFEAIAIDSMWDKSNLIPKMAHSHNMCKNYALKNGYDYILHLESDVFPPHDVIERLMAHQKNVIGAIYHSDEGLNRYAMVYEDIELSPNRITTITSSHHNGEIRLFDGTVKKVAHVGLGCVLISSKVLSKIVFRYEENRNAAPDTLFAEDCKMMNIPINLDTSIVCRHDNQPWGLYGIDYK